MDTQLSDELDRSFGAGPEHRPLEATLDAGHRALRRRRRLRWSSAVAAVAVLAAVGAWQAVPRSDPPQVAAPDDRTEDANRTWRDLDPIPQFDDTEEQVFYDSDEVLVVRDGATVLSRTDDPWIVEGIDRSVALIIRDGSRTYWSFAWQAANDWAHSVSVRSEDVHGASFEQWLDSEIALNAPPGAQPDHLTLTPDGTLRAASGARIIDQTEDLPARLAPEGYTAVAALVSIGDAEVCGVVRRTAGRPAESIYLNAFRYGPDLAGCIAGLGTWGAHVED